MPATAAVPVSGLVTASIIWPVSLAARALITRCVVVVADPTTSPPEVVAWPLTRLGLT